MRVLAALGIALSQTLAAQSPTVRVQGVAFDSLRGQPLRDELVAIRGLASNATTDERGRFYFEHVPLGTHTFVVQHPALDSSGFSGISRRLTVTDEAKEMRLSIPSFATLWRTACGGRPPPRDSGLVFGTIRDVATGKPVVGAF